MQELGPDPVVHADAARDVLHIGAHLFAKVGDFVDESDLGRQKRVGGVFDEFGRAPIDEEQGWLVEVQRPRDQSAHDRAGPLVRRAHDDPVRAFEIADRRALPEELRIGDGDEIGVGPRFRDDPLDFVACADRHGRLRDDHGEAVEGRGDLLRGGIDEGQIGVAIAATRRSAHRDEDSLGAPHRLSDVLAEEKTLAPDVGCDEIVPGSKIGISPRFSAATFGLVPVDAGHDVPEIGETGPRDWPTYPHPILASCMPRHESSTSGS